MPMGNRVTAPPRSSATRVPAIGEPDIVNRSKFLVPAESPGLRDLFADIPIDGDRYIKAIQTRSACRLPQVVHHALSCGVTDSIIGDMSNERPILVRSHPGRRRCIRKGLA
jgi:hypothetical protein